MPFRRRRGLRSKTPSRKVWGGWLTRSAVNGAPETGRLSNNQFESNWLLSPQDALDFYDEPTVMRMIFQWNTVVGEDSGSNNAEEWYVLCIMGIWVTRADEETGDPPFINLEDTTHDYLFWHAGQFGHQPNDVFRFNNSGSTATLFDIKARRKIPEGYGLAFQVISVDETAAAGDRLEDVCWVTTGRILMIDH